MAYTFVFIPGINAKVCDQMLSSRHHSLIQRLIGDGDGVIRYLCLNPEGKICDRLRVARILL